MRSELHTIKLTTAVIALVILIVTMIESISFSNFDPKTAICRMNDGNSKSFNISEIGDKYSYQTISNYYSIVIFNIMLYLLLDPLFYFVFDFNIKKSGHNINIHVYDNKSLYFIIYLTYTLYLLILLTEYDQIETILKVVHKEMEKSGCKMLCNVDNFCDPIFGYENLPTLFTFSLACSLHFLFQAYMLSLLVVCYKYNYYNEKKDINNNHVIIEIASEEYFCIICKNTKKNMMLKPCNHIISCEKCYDINKSGFMDNQCSLCRTNIVSIEKVFY